MHDWLFIICKNITYPNDKIIYCSLISLHIAGLYKYECFFENNFLNSFHIILLAISIIAIYVYNVVFGIFDVKVLSYK